LQYLDLSNNSLTRLSNSIANHSALMVLKLHGNQLNVVRIAVTINAAVGNNSFLL
jgi:Leucine-rich repeat (LRR) protein